MRNRLFASFHLLLGTVCTIAVTAASGCTLDTQPQVVSDGLGAMMCTAFNLCDGGVPSGTGGNSGNSGNSGAIAVGTAGFAASGTGATSGTGTAGNGVAGNRVPVAGKTGTGGASATGGTPVIVAGTGGMSAPIDAGPPPPTLNIGDPCTDDALCKSDHCDGVCCSAGDCCATVADCKTTTADGIQIACNNATTCQGSGGTIQCSSSRCVAIGGAANDSACDAKTKASDCGYYQPIFCNGGAEQAAPMCPTSCQTDGDCLPFVAHCDQICKPNVLNGQRCTQDLDCGSKHCGSGFCCGGGDCCNTAANCPASYSAAPTCDTKATCQGTQKVAVCGNFQCGSSVAQDDEACTTSVLANDCASATDVYCKGGRDQQTPKCGGACTNTAQCDAGNYCASGTCQPKVATPMSCTSPDMCTSGMCGANKRCCSTNGECCVTAADCTASTTAPTCDDPTTCKGTSITPVVCQVGLCGPGTPSNACDGKMTQCGVGYLPAMAVCPNTKCKTTCTSSTDCTSGYMCDPTGACVQMTAPMAGTSGGAAGGTAVPTPQGSRSSGTGREAMSGT